MNIYYSELYLIGGDAVQNVDRMIADGAENIEVMLDGPGWDRFDFRIDAVAAELKKRPVTYSVHTPVWDTNLTSENYFVRQGVMESLKQSIVLASKLNASHVVVHPGFCQSPFFKKETARKRAEESVLQLLEFNRDYGMLLLMENVGNKKNSIFTMEEYAGFLNEFPKEAGYLVDIGHAHMNHWNLTELLLAVQDRLYAVHIHDNDGAGDQHCPMGEGNTEWDSVFSTIRSMGRDISLVLEYNTGVPGEKMSEGQRRLKRYFNL